MIQAKTLLIGGTGFLGSTLSRSPQITAPGRELLDLGQPLSPAFLDFFRSGGFTHLIICGGITDVEKCAKEPELSARVNVHGTIELLELAKREAIKPIFFSSDYVFAGGEGLYAEDAPTEPETNYGRHKLLVERFIAEHFSDYLIFRTSKLMGKIYHPRNILSPLIQNLSQGTPVGCFADQWVTPVFVEDIAEIVRLAMAQNLSGLFHLGTRRIFTRAELGNFLARELGLDASLVRATRVGDQKFLEKRPSKNTLHCAKIEKALGFRFCEVEEALPLLRQLR